MEFVEFKGKTLDEALMQASVELGMCQYRPGI